MTTTTTTTKAATSEKLLLPAVASFSPLEFWCLTKLDRWYALSQSVRCPFFRRRYGDALDVFEAFLRGVVIRAECLPMMGPPQAHRPPPATKRRHDATAKHTELTPEELLERVEKDWKADTGKGYYVTGKLTASIYRNDCLFLGPDPDLPLRSLRKYVGVASHLFDYRTSSATLESLEIVGKKKNNNNNYINDGCDPDNHKTKSKEPSLYETSETNGFPDGEETTTTILVARWKLRGVLRLPWKPSLPLLSGETIYHIGEDGLIACHEESWDCSAAKAFCYTFLPALANRIWRGEQKTKKKKAMVERERD